MLFNSYVFLFLFLPITLFVFYKIGSIGHHRVAVSWLVAASLFYYGWWNVAYLGLILGSMLFNYGFGVVLGGNTLSEKLENKKKLILAVGVVSNIALLGYFKYANFFVDTLNNLSGSNYNLEKIILPLAISFFTFQQIAYLVDAYRGETREYNFLHYCLFVCFFPQLIAGPIVHHKKILPQFARESTYKFNFDNLSIGLTIFCIGLFKKVVLADGLSLYVGPVFDVGGDYSGYDLIGAWIGALSYTFQLYFDFSGYSDMAIGVGRMFGIRLPDNFNSPYKAKNIIDFWRRWHITLSTFLRDYLYVPLGGNRKGTFRKYLNLMVTMLLGGLWHGAGWTFVVWGGLHGSYLIINHFFLYIKNKLNLSLESNYAIWKIASRLLTFIAVVVAWVFFRSSTFEQAIEILYAMLGMGALKSEGLLLQAPAIGIILLSFVVAYWLPNSREYMRLKEPSDLQDKKESRFLIVEKLTSFNYNKTSAAVIAFLFLMSLLMMQSVQKSEFLYYDF